MHRHLEIALTGLVSVRLHPLRSLVSFVAVVVVLLRIPACCVSCCSTSGGASAAKNCWFSGPSWVS